MPFARAASETRPGRDDITWCLLAFGACFLAIGLPYWVLPYGQVNLPSTLMTPALWAVAIAAASLRWLGRASFWRAVAFSAGAVPAVVAVRISVETSIDPTSHNLFPFELVIALGLGLISALPGAIAGSVLARATGSPAPRTGLGS